MLALIVQPGKPGSTRLEERSEPEISEGTLLVQALAVGICGTDREIIQGHYGSAPPGQEYLVLGHESIGRVLEAPGDSGFSAGDLVVGIVRHPDPVPCTNCVVGEWDMCRNGRYTEHGIKQLHGFCAERFRIEPEFAIKLDPALHRVGVLLEPASIVAKAWEHIEHIGRRARWEPRRVLITGAGPIGLLAAMMGVQRELEVRVLDRMIEGPKPTLVRDLGAKYYSSGIEVACSDADVVLECTGAGQLVFDAIRYTGPGGIVCLTGLSSGKRMLEADIAALNRSMVLENDVVFGSVNANRRHYVAAAEALARVDLDWLERLITRRVPLVRWEEALTPQPRDVKTLIDLTFGVSLCS
jgi:threonine dehydrogenase-like Zn-dependent dehydrogenase